MTNILIAPVPSYETPIQSPTMADETYFVQPWMWLAMMDSARNVRVRRTSSHEHGECDLIECEINGAPTVFVHLRKIDGRPKEFGWGWHRDTLRSEIASITDPRHRASLAILFGDLFMELMHDQPARARA